MATNYYSVLRLSEAATAADIKRQYRKLALALHPDKNKAPDAKDAFQQLCAAYEVLSDESKRREYDAYVLPQFKRQAQKAEKAASSSSNHASSSGRHTSNSDNYASSLSHDNTSSSSRHTSSSSNHTSSSSRSPSDSSRHTSNSGYFASNSSYQTSSSSEYASNSSQNSQNFSRDQIVREKNEHYEAIKKIQREMANRADIYSSMRIITHDTIFELEENITKAQMAISGINKIEKRVLAEEAAANNRAAGTRHSGVSEGEKERKGRERQERLHSKEIKKRRLSDLEERLRHSTSQLATKESDFRDANSRDDATIDRYYDKISVLKDKFDMERKRVGKEARLKAERKGEEAHRLEMEQWTRERQEKDRLRAQRDQLEKEHWAREKLAKDQRKAQREHNTAYEPAYRYSENQYRESARGVCHH